MLSTHDPLALHLAEEAELVRRAEFRRRTEERMPAADPARSPLLRALALPHFRLRRA